MHIDDIIQRVRTAAAADSSAAGEARPAERSGHPKAVPQSADGYHVRQFLDLPPTDLVPAAYRCLLRRDPDPDAEAYRRQLEAGDLSPVVLLGKLRFSTEGRRQGVRVRGLVPRLAYAYLRRVPLLGGLVDLGVGLVRLPGFRRHTLNELQVLHERLATKADASDLSTRAKQEDFSALAEKSELDRQQMRREMDRKADRSEVLAYREAVRYAELYFREVGDQLQQMITALQASGGGEAENRPPLADPLDQLEAGRYDKLYLDFEALYRGSQDEVAAVLQAYRELVLPLADSGLPPVALDLGSGRGEMLRCLEQWGFRATGVDLNQLAVSDCRQAGLQAVHGDARSYLDGLEAESLGLVTAMHLVEHLSHEQLFRLLQAALRALAPGGLLILETPNPRNLLVGAGDFYRDFTHLKPLFPDTLRFLLEHFGYAEARTYFFAEAEGESRRLLPAEGFRFDELQDYLRVSRDYAVVGCKR